MVHPLMKVWLEFDKTHPGLGQLMVVNLIVAKANRTIIIVAYPAMGKDVLMDALKGYLGNTAAKYTSVNISGMVHLQADYADGMRHFLLHDLRAEKSGWSRLATLSLLTTLSYDHNVNKLSIGKRITIQDFHGSIHLCMQPKICSEMVADDAFEEAEMDKSLRWWHLIRAIKPNKEVPKIKLEWGVPIESVNSPKRFKQNCWRILRILREGTIEDIPKRLHTLAQLLIIGKTQWSEARTMEYMDDYLRALAALDGRTEVKRSDYVLLVNLLSPMQLQRYIIEHTSEDTTTVIHTADWIFHRNRYNLLVEAVTWGEPTIETIAEDLKLNPHYVLKLIEREKDWFFEKIGNPSRLGVMERTKDVLRTCRIRL